MISPANYRNETEFVDRHCGGSWPTSEKLLLKYQTRIYNIVLRICANPEDAADLTQQTFVRAMENLTNFRGSGTFYNWMVRIAVNLTVSHCRKNAKFHFLPFSAQRGENHRYSNCLPQEMLEEDSSFEPQRVAENKEAIRTVLAAMAGLDIPHRTVIILHDIKGVNYADIAKILDIKMGTVKSRLSRARARLRDILQDKDKARQIICRQQRSFCLF